MGGGRRGEGGMGRGRRGREAEEGALCAQHRTPGQLPTPLLRLECTIHFYTSVDVGAPAKEVSTPTIEELHISAWLALAHVVGVSC